MMCSQKPARIAAFGYGNRVRKYLKYIESHPEEAALVSVVDTDLSRLEDAREKFAVSPEMCFTSPEAFFSKKLDIDGLIIGTPDDVHYQQCLKALDMGYQVLLEKPVAQSLQQCDDIKRKSEETGLPVTVCYVLRYHPFYKKLKEILDKGNLGEIVSVNHIVNVGIDRTMHTYVRGPWSNADNSNPMFLSKCCHDVDLIVWLTGAKAARISSFGSLKWFRKENSPAGSAERCVNCKIEKECPFSAIDLYQRRHEWISNFNVPKGKSLDEVLSDEIENGRFGRCVYQCNNDVVDNQIVSMIMDNGVVVTVSMDCFTRKDDRHTNIKCVYGEIVADDTKITVTDFRTRKEEVFDFTGVNNLPYHANADLSIVGDFIRSLRGEGSKDIPGIDSSVESHKICFLAEDSRKSGETISVK